jgi:hypothetical protein
VVKIKRTKKELEQLLADALAEKEQQAREIHDLTESVTVLTETARDLRRELENALVENYRGVEGARRWLAEHIGYDLRQVAKCPTCLGTRTTPTNPEQIGAEFRCLGCGQVFYIVKVLDTSAYTIRQAVKESKYSAYASVVDVKVESSPVDSGPRQLTSGHK